METLENKTEKTQSKTSKGTTLRVTGWQWSAAELPVQVNAIVS